MLRLSKAQRGLLTELIGVVKQTGEADDFTVAAFAALMKQLEASGVEAAVLACTELPLVSERLANSDVQMKLIDPTELLAAVRFPLKNLDFLLKNLDFLLKNADFLLKNR